MFVGIDPPKALVLGRRMRAAGRTCEELRTDVEQALDLAQLTSSVPGRLTTEGTDLERVGLVLTNRAKLADGQELDIDRLAELLDLSEDAVRDAIRALDDPDRDPDTNPLLDLVASERNLFVENPTSLRDDGVDLPEPGTEPELDAAIERFDNEILPRLQNGERIDPDDLTEQQRRDIERITVALGGDETTIAVTRTEPTRGSQGDDAYRDVTRDVAIADTDTSTMLRYITTRMEHSIEIRRATVALERVTAKIDRSDLAAEAARLGMGERELRQALAVNDLLELRRDGRLSVLGGGEADGTADGIGPTFPDRADYPPGAEGDRDYLRDVERDRLEAIERGDNVVGPVGSEQTLVYEVMGAMFGSQNFAFSHDYQATQAEIENLNDPGFLGVDLPNAVTATVGYAAAVVTAPAIAGLNLAFGTDIDVGIVGTAVADGLWSAFGYDVEAPTIAESQAALEAEQVQEERELRDHFRNSGDDKDGNDFDDLGDPNDTKDPNDPNDTGGSGIP